MIFFRICSGLAQHRDWRGVGKLKVEIFIFPTVLDIKEKQFSSHLISKDKVNLFLHL